MRRIAVSKSGAPCGRSQPHWAIASATADPSLGVRNRAAKGRSETWAEGEAARMFKRAWRLKYHGLAAVIAVAWATQLSAGRRAGAAGLSDCARTSTERRSSPSAARRASRSVGRSTTRTLAALHAYLEILGIELHDDAYIFRNRSGAPYSSDTLGDDFRDVRVAGFGDGESRTLADFRRSGAQ